MDADGLLPAPDTPVFASTMTVRVGHHCAQPVHRRFGVAATARATASVYTTDAEVEAFREALAGVRAFFGADDDTRAQRHGGDR